MTTALLSVVILMIFFSMRNFVMKMDISCIFKLKMILFKADNPQILIDNCSHICGVTLNFCPFYIQGSIILRLSSGPGPCLILSGFLSSQPTIKLRECGHNRWNCWLTPQRPSSNALLCLITSIAVKHKGAHRKGHWMIPQRKAAAAWGTSCTMHHVLIVMNHYDKKC